MKIPKFVHYCIIILLFTNILSLGDDESKMQGEDPCLNFYYWHKPRYCTLRTAKTQKEFSEQLFSLTELNAEFWVLVDTESKNIDYIKDPEWTLCALLHHYFKSQILMIISMERNYKCMDRFSEYDSLQISIEYYDCCYDAGFTLDMLQDQYMKIDSLILKYTFKHREMEKKAIIVNESIGKSIRYFRNLLPQDCRDFLICDSLARANFVRGLIDQYLK